MLTDLELAQLRHKGAEAPYWQRRLAEITSAKPPLAVEKRAVVKMAVEPPTPHQKDAWMAPSQRMVLALLRDGRARFEGEITGTCRLCHDTVSAVLSRLRRRGEVEQHYVGNFRLWSRTTREEA